MTDCYIDRGQDWKNYPLKTDRYCPVCGANKPIEQHETWCPQSAPSEFQAWIDEEADVTDYKPIYQSDSGFLPTHAQEEAAAQNAYLNAPAGQETGFTPGFFEDWQRGSTSYKTNYHAPERPDEDWGLRDTCLAPPTSLGAYFIHPDGIYQDGVKISSTFAEPAIGIGGAPTRATTLPELAAERKQYPVASGVLDYFPDALVAIAYLSNKGNEQHNPGQPLHWDRSKSGDEGDTMIRHFLQRGSLDTDGVRHSVKMAWRALALLQKEIEQEGR
jgi:hypothetical protein